MCMIFRIWGVHGCWAAWTLVVVDVTAYNMLHSHHYANSFFDLILSCCWIGAIILIVGFLIAGSGGQCLELQLGCLQSMQQAPALSSSSRLLSPTWALRISTEFCYFVCIYNCFWGMERNFFSCVCLQIFAAVGRLTSHNQSFAFPFPFKIL